MIDEHVPGQAAKVSKPPGRITGLPPRPRGGPASMAELGRVLRSMDTKLHDAERQIDQLLARQARQRG